MLIASKKPIWSCDRQLLAVLQAQNSTKHIQKQMGFRNVMKCAPCAPYGRHIAVAEHARADDSHHLTRTCFFVFAFVLPGFCSSFLHVFTLQGHRRCTYQSVHSWCIGALGLRCRCCRTWTMEGQTIPQSASNEQTLLNKWEGKHFDYISALTSLNSLADLHFKKRPQIQELCRAVATTAVLCEISLSVSMEPAATSPQLASLRSRPFGRTMLSKHNPQRCLLPHYQLHTIEQAVSQQAKTSHSASKNILCWSVLRVFFANYLSKGFQTHTHTDWYEKHLAASSLISMIFWRACSETVVQCCWTAAQNRTGFSSFLWEKVSLMFSLVDLLQIPVSIMDQLMLRW